ncbi:ABC transporter permease [Tumebacillus permanentifrigoris]|uniref:Sodium transport system permease protein n=1 Tax=Tumebacillus permanentifrigoris TaxID=378543 RepID=A0A316D3R3_9BACL|nr:ABC transporter permease [Tumebacillus permanentifrigoris]PWK04964.1 sodium transport system permease protein [Tumebacillus permanentifrigoris]
MKRGWWIVFQKEIKELLTDRKMWLGSIVLPLLVMPALMLFIAKMQAGAAEDARKNINVALVGHNARVEQAISKIPEMHLVEKSDPLQALKDGDVRAVVTIGEQFDQQVQAQKPAGLTIAYDPSNQKSEAAHGLVQQTLQVLSQEVAAERLTKLNVPPETLLPFDVQSIDTSEENQKAGSALGFIVPLLLVLSCVTGAMPVATDLMAGEKERGTLEALLTAPVNSRQVLTGKLLSVSVMSFLSALLSTLAMVATFRFMPSSEGDSSQDLHFSLSYLSAVDVLTILGALFFVSIMFGALMLGVSSLAKTYKEAQTYLAPFVFVAMVPVYATMMMSINEIPTQYFLLPVLNTTTLMKEVLYGVSDPAHVAMVFGSSLVFAILAVVLTANLFRRESLIVKG